MSGDPKSWLLGRALKTTRASCENRTSLDKYEAMRGPARKALPLLKGTVQASLFASKFAGWRYVPHGCLLRCRAAAP